MLHWRHALCLAPALLLPTLLLAREPATTARLGPGTVLHDVTLTVQVDGEHTVRVRRDFVLPEGRTSTLDDGRTRYVGELEAVEMTIGAMSFKVAPTLKVTSSGGEQTVAVVGRFFGRQAMGDTNQFATEVDFELDGQTYHYTARATQGCMSGDTPIAMADGSWLPIAEILPGEFVLDPVTGAHVEVLAVRKGPEPLPLHELGYGSVTVRFSGEHPLPLADGLEVARDVEIGDQVMGADGAWHRVTVHRVLPPVPGQQVYNLDLAVRSGDPKDHLVLAHGLVVGDNWLQRELGRKD
ncbi:MAG: Hint domain-containing protein [Pseudomonadota bacterium]